MYPQHLSTATWRKSSYSAENGSCVEVAFADLSTAVVVGVRDSKNIRAGHLTMPVRRWKAFVAATRDCISGQ